MTFSLRRQVLRGMLPAPPKRMSGHDDNRHGWTCLELNCSGEQPETAQITFSSNGAIYRVTCGPLSDTEFARLDQASRSDKLVRLVFPRSVVTLSHITLECPKPGWAQLEGIVMSPSVGREDSAGDTLKSV